MLLVVILDIPLARPLGVQPRDVHLDTRGTHQLHHNQRDTSQHTESTISDQRDNRRQQAHLSMRVCNERCKTTGVAFCKARQVCLC
jgi:hypothetical protein